MNTFRSLVALLALTAALVAGCSSESDSPQSDTSQPRSPQATSTGAANPDAPDCAELQPATSSDHQDCALQAGDRTISVKYKSDGSIELKSGASIATERTVAESPSYPELRDLDGDGADELLVPILPANANIQYAVYLVGDEGITRAGDLSGSLIEPADNGEIKVAASASASTLEVGFWRITDGELEHIATVSVSKRPDDPTCSLVDDDGIAAAGISKADAEREYCAQARE